MSEKMREYIRIQPAVLTKIVEERDNNLAGLQNGIAGEPYDRIILVGSGSSYNSCAIARALMEKLYGCEVTAIAPTSDADLSVLAGGRKLILAVSQEGASSNTYKFIQTAKEKMDNIVTAAVTAVPGSKLTQICQETMIVGCGDEKLGPKTVGVTSTVLTLWLIALELANAEGRAANYQGVVNDMLTDIQLMEGNVKKSEEWVNNNKAIFAKSRSIAFITESGYVGTAQECALKLNETIYVPSVAYDFEEFLHGPFCLFESNSVTCVVMIGPDDDAERIMRMVKYARGQGISCVVVSAGVENLEGADVELELKNADYGTLALLLPVQFVAATVSEYIGQLVDSRDFMTFMNLMNSKLR